MPPGLQFVGLTYCESELVVSETTAVENGVIYDG